MSESHAFNPVQGSEKRMNGLLLALLSVPAGMVLWGVVWSFGFIASIVSFAIAWLAIFLYGKGAGADPDKQAAKWLVGIIVLGVVLSFMTGLALDLAASYGEEFKTSSMSAFSDSRYWNALPSFLTTAEVWKQYVGDIVMSLLFAGLGVYGIVKALVMPPAQVSADKAEKEAK